VVNIPTPPKSVSAVYEDDRHKERYAINVRHEDTCEILRFRNHQEANQTRSWYIEKMGYGAREVVPTEPTFAQLMPEHGDMVVFVRDGGRSAGAYVRHGEELLKMPVRWTVNFQGKTRGLPPAQPLTPIRLQVTAGWTHQQWKQANQTGDYNL
jgi:hypothetical protein